MERALYILCRAFCVMKLQTLKPRVQTLNTSRVSTQVVPGSWRGDKSSTQRGYGYKWQKYREGFLRANPLCVMCQAEDKVTEATVVDHITPHEGDQKLFWSPSNHQGLCNHHHSSTKQKMEKGRGGIKSLGKSTT